MLIHCRDYYQVACNGLICLPDAIVLGSEGFYLFRVASLTGKVKNGGT